MMKFSGALVGMGALLALAACEPYYARQQTELYLGTAGVVDHAVIQRTSHYVLPTSSTLRVQWAGVGYPELRSLLSQHLCDALRLYFYDVQINDEEPVGAPAGDYRLELAFWYWEERSQRWVALAQPMSLKTVKQYQTVKRRGVVGSKVWKGPEITTRKEEEIKSYRTRVRISVIAQQNRKVIDSIFVVSENGFFGDTDETIIGDDLLTAVEQVAAQLAGKPVM